MNSIGQRINKLVKYFSNGNNSDFATKIGVSEANIRNYINDRAEPKFNILEKIAINFEINYEWLLTGEGEMLKSKVSNNNLEPEIKFEEIQGLTDVALYDVQLSEEKLKNANKRIELLEELVESYKLEIKTLKNELSRGTKKIKIPKKVN
ncbi:MULTISPECIES: helix-turn-helix domain-containing protein [unclassified Apibacter]|uniref:helix-turn-helix domain-containing protein n=1 Tax=unclassified Apibacter TaxID=2630820 RepID=UPI00135E6859|nr:MULTISPECIES: helix-turn-helix transcriptional regulator [unclassified Apibacter]MXP05600.1 helix-turn-helix domain-containing protein [Apibacter sp. B3546]MXP12290.1 helix-turn-helix domain-containing protein [Apibacter sp. B3239]